MVRWINENQKGDFLISLIKNVFLCLFKIKDNKIIMEEVINKDIMEQIQPQADEQTFSWMVMLSIEIMLKVSFLTLILF